MKRFSWLISKYIIQAILPYFIFSWLLLSVILFVQQASRYSDIFFSSAIPSNVVWQLTFALVPNVIAFTCPMAILVGVIIGLSKLQGDSELIAIRTIGVGNLQITFPILILGLLFSGLTFTTNLYGIPLAAQVVRKVALQAALYKLESPIEPGVFNTEIYGYTIYVKDGDLENGTWKNIFIFNDDKQNNSSRLITSKSGRIDTNGNVSELVLENAIINYFSTENKPPKITSENLGKIRFRIKTKREEVIENISKTERSPEELGLSELTQLSKIKNGRDKTEIEIVWQRRLLLSVTPLIFSLLGTALILRFNRTGKSFGVFLALLSLIAYYLITLLGEQLARTGIIGVVTAGLFPLISSSLVIIWFYLSNRYLLKRSVGFNRFKAFNIQEKYKKVLRKNSSLNLTVGILDFDIIINLLKYFFIILAFLTSVFLIFTAFERWRFAGEIENGFVILIKYLTFLLPFIYIQLSPSSLMIAILTVFVIKSRQNEIVSWTSAGQSVYRLLLPCLILMLTMGVINWGVQETILPETNQKHDALRDQLRSRGATVNKVGKYWVANDKRIYSFEINSEQFKKNQPIKNLTIYEFSDSETKLQTIYKAPQAVWETNKIKVFGIADKTVLTDGKSETTQTSNLILYEDSNPFNNFFDNPNHLSARQVREQIRNSQSDLEKRILQVSLEKKYTTLFLPLIVILLAAPFAISINAKGKVFQVGYAVGVWLLFLAVTNIFEQFGNNGYLSPALSIWSPLIVFSFIGAFLLTKVRT